MQNVAELEEAGIIKVDQVLWQYYVKSAIHFKSITVQSDNIDYNVQIYVLHTHKQYGNNPSISLFHICTRCGRKKTPTIRL